MMTMKAFLDKYTGQKVKYGQCVDLVRQYFKDVWGLPDLEGLGADGGACEFYHRYRELPLTRKYIYLTAYTVDNEPEVGDVVIFEGNAYNKYGHCAILLDFDSGTRLMQVFEQDGVTMKGGAKVGHWDTGRLLGWYRKRSFPLRIEE